MRPAEADGTQDIADALLPELTMMDRLERAFTRAQAAVTKELCQELLEQDDLDKLFAEPL